jgi:hypothetical protein
VDEENDMDEWRQLKSSGNIITEIELRLIILEVRGAHRTEEKLIRHFNLKMWKEGTVLEN